MATVERAAGAARAKAFLERVRSNGGHTIADVRNAASRACELLALFANGRFGEDGQGMAKQEDYHEAVELAEFVRSALNRNQRKPSRRKESPHAVR